MVNKIKIALVSTGKANLPEIEAYKEYFSETFDVSVVNKNDDLSCYDVLWYFMGFGGNKINSNQFLIHEFSSISVPPFSKTKNFIKKIILPKPNLRVFLNESVQQQFNFNDRVPFCYRDMGVNDKPVVERNYKKYDILYVGAIAGRQLDDALNLILSYQLDCKIAILGKVEEKFKEKYKDTNVIFLGQVPYNQVATVISESNLCLNWIPNVYPYNIQTSTKFLEYLAQNKQIISNSYPWVDSYCQQHNIEYINIHDSNSIRRALSSVIIQKSTHIPSSWREVIMNSGIENKIKSYFEVVK
ncbi:glycosyltransferase [Escherichia albertii]|uniref:Putative glycosyltransferase n=1 Tax=Escherichia albertii TaxID=208962 RepID=A0A5A4U8I3_ESCAL|nr:glycosyltransferase [Escherichia albertii]EGQ0034431.1 glycosyltransferase family 4 protein [Escherichia albertii]MCQ8935695.1 glycosyltransferase [Escherichia albertii]MCZ8822794.1 glycosyltransferase [Escherichia albertii]MCZ8875819.1 glycosyltransferase [Escherichia albertii]MCZ8993224.1 glycosyltransferase [Escherichia albertii]